MLVSEMTEKLLYVDVTTRLHVDLCMTLTQNRFSHWYILS